MPACPAVSPPAWRWGDEIRLFPWVALVVACAGTATAQIDVDCSLNHDTVCEYEPLMGTMTVVNHSGQDVTFKGEQPGSRCGFYIMDRDGDLLPMRNNVDMALPDVVPAQGRAAFTNNLALLYDLRKSGAYTVQAWVEWSGKSYISRKLFLDVEAGAEVGRVDASLPNPPGGFRLYTLRTMQRERSHRLLLRIDDEEGRLCYGVFDLGPFIPMRPPELRADGDGLVHVLHQMSPSQYLYSVFDPEGRVMERKEYGHQYADVTMASGEGGSVIVHAASTGKSHTPEAGPAFQTLPKMR